MFAHVQLTKPSIAIDPVLRQGSDSSERRNDTSTHHVRYSGRWNTLSNPVCRSLFAHETRRSGNPVALPPSAGSALHTDSCWTAVSKRMSVTRRAQERRDFLLIPGFVCAHRRFDEFSFSTNMRLRHIFQALSDFACDSSTLEREYILSIVSSYATTTSYLTHSTDTVHLLPSPVPLASTMTSRLSWRRLSQKASLCILRSVSRECRVRT